MDSKLIFEFVKQSLINQSLCLRQVSEFEKMASTTKGDEKKAMLQLLAYADHLYEEAHRCADQALTIAENIKNKKL